MLKDRLSEMKVDMDKLIVNVNTTCQLGRVFKKNVCGELNNYTSMAFHTGAVEFLEIYSGS